MLSINCSERQCYEAEVPWYNSGVVQRIRVLVATVVQDTVER